MLTNLLRRLGREAYTLFVPFTDEKKVQNTENYLPSLWKDFPAKIALSHTLLCLAVFALPLFVIGSPRLLPQLTGSQRAQYASALLRSRFYLIRLIGYGVKGHALIAAFSVQASPSKVKNRLVESQVRM